MNIVSDITARLNKIVQEQSELYESKEYICSLSLDDIVTISMASQWIQYSDNREKYMNDYIDEVTEKLDRSNKKTERFIKEMFPALLDTK
jgi:hypothetical protein